jgi:plastocyanin
MKRREFFEKAGIGSAALVTLAAQGRANGKENEHAQHNHGAISGPLATAVVSFGAWVSGPNTPQNVSNRRPNIGATAGLPINVHALIPNEVKIKAGGTVNYIIAGFHLIVVYGNGKRPEDVITSPTIPPFGAPVPPLIEDPTDRVYRGIDPTVLPFLQGPPQPAVVPPGTTATFQPVLQDRVEVVHFPDPGRYLVICGVLPHFNEGMYGYVEVIP